MSFWLDTLADWLTAGETAMLVTVAELKGSGPREAGARMLVSEGQLAGTIGGGELEWRAIAAARDLLTRGGEGRVLTNALGPDLGQCCGGLVTLALEPFAPSDLAWVQRLIDAADTPAGAGRTLAISATGAVTRDVVPAPTRAFSAEVLGESVWFSERILRDATPLWLFGAGHVGRALVRALSPLPFEVTWIDGRLDAFADGVCTNARRLNLAMPELVVEEAPPNAWYLVMTHSHTLDEDICNAIMARGDFGYLGLIGSATKHARFAKRLLARGCAPEAVARLHGPIGLPDLGGKSPAIIAASVAADLLLRREAAGRSAQPEPLESDGNERTPRNA